MAGGIFLVQNNGELLRMDEQAYDAEKRLQELLERYPDLLAGDQIDSAVPRRWLFIEREVAIPVEDKGPEPFALDHLFLDQDGVPTLVEVKRSSDTRIRREVVGQMLDYAANAVAYWPAEKVREAFEARCADGGENPEEALAVALGEGLDYEEFWQRVKTNLQARRIRLLFVADEIPRELRRVVEFLNETMDPVEVLAVEVRQFVGEQHQALVPRVIGQTLSAQQRKGRGAAQPKTDRGAFLEAWAGDPAVRERYERLLQLAAGEGWRIIWGVKGFALRVIVPGGDVTFVQGYPPGSNGGRLRLPRFTIMQKVKDPEPITEWYTRECEKLSALDPSPNALWCVMTRLTPAEEQELHRILKTVASMIREHGLAPKE